MTRLAGESVGGMLRAEIEQRVDELYDKSTVEVRGKDRVMLAYKVADVGISTDKANIVDRTLSYPWWQRLIPSSILWAAPDVETFEPTIDEQALATFVERNQHNFVIAGENAHLTVDGATVKIAGGSQGARLGADQFVRGVKEAEYSLGKETDLAVNFTHTDPAIRATDLTEQQRRAQAIVDHDMELVFEDIAVAADKATIASWLVFDQAGASRAEEIVIGLDAEKVTTFIKSHFDKKVVQPAGITEVYLTDGVEQSRKSGPNGRAIDMTQMVKKIEQVLTNSTQAEVSLPVMTTPVPPRINNNHTFTKSPAGLQAYVNSLGEDGDIRVTIRQIGGSGWYASYRGGEQTVAASTYKVYVVAYALNQIAEKKLSYDDPINGMTMRECIERTIVQSDNACPEAMIEKFGRTNLNNFLYARGYSRATTFTNATASQTTTNDLHKAMLEIDNGQLVNGAERTLMLQLMARTHHRQGIPAGSAGSVNNKVGFLWSYLNDAAIVKHPSGTYVISIMTNNQSWSKIAEITKKAESLMY